MAEPAASADTHHLPKRILLATFGTIGDLHPLIGLALGLKSRGHEVSLASTEAHRPRVEAAGIAFHSLRPEIPETPELYAKIFDPRRGWEFTFRRLLLPAIRDTYADLAAAAGGADLLIAAPNVFAAPLLSEKVGIPWILTVLQPSTFFSAYDPPPPPGLAWATKHRRQTPRINRVVRDGFMLLTRPWFEPVRALRRELKLNPGPVLPFQPGYAPALTLALFSPLLGEPQPDWPSPSLAPGFISFDQRATQPMPPTLAAFLDGGSPPVIFTLASFALTTDAAHFYRESLDAARALGRRALLVIGRPENAAALPHPLPEGSFAINYAPYSAIFPHAAAIVHRGGIGATGAALAAGRPMLIVPLAFDQPDNAERVAALGVARVLSARRYDARSAARELAALLSDETVGPRAAALSRRLATEDALTMSCDAIERVAAASVRPAR
jgi:UDP:flavonoid glycosyltransferase YjiC (YdhE family)